MRKRLLVLMMTVMMVLVLAAPVMADRDKSPKELQSISPPPAMADLDKPPKEPQPISPPGRYRGEGNEPEQAADPLTGRANRFYHGCPQNGSTECL